MHPSHVWIDWTSLNAADAHAGGNSDLNIALVAPVSAPGVLDEVVLNAAGVSTVADCKNTVVQGGSARSGGDYT